MTLALEAIDLTKQLDNMTVVDHINLQIPQGTIYGVVGANGAGKTTLLRLLHGVMWPTSGQVKLFGQPVPRESAEIRQRVHHVAAEGNIYGSFRVDDLVRFSRQLYTQWDEQRCQRLLAALELPKKRLIRNLSLGMRMQLRLVIRLSAHPDVLLLDEPTNGLDAVVKRQFLQLILDEALHDGTTVVMATHNLNDLERMADGVAVMYRGKLIADGLIDTLKSRMRTYQVVLPSGIPDALTHSGIILKSEQRGMVWTIVAEDQHGQVEQALRQVSSHIEVIPQDLEEVFTYLLLKEGYARETILLA